MQRETCAPPPNEDLRREASRLVGLYAGQCSPSEYQHLIAAGILRKSWDTPGGFLGMAKLAWADEELGRED